MENQIELKTTPINTNHKNKHYQNEELRVDDSGPEEHLININDSKSRMNNSKKDQKVHNIASQIQISIADILKAVPFGRYQNGFISIVFFHYLNVALMMYNYGYFFMYPKYQCQMNMDASNPLASDNYQSCSREEICGSRNSINYRIDQTNEYSLQNWITQLDLTCTDSFKISLFGTLDFVGQLISSIVMPPIADKYGKKYFTITATYLQIIMYIMMLVFSRSTSLYYLCTFIFGVLFISKNYITYAHMVDMVGTERVSSYTSVLFCVDSMIFIVCPVILKFISRNTEIFLYMSLGFAIVTAVLMRVLGFNESLKFNLESGKYDQAKRDIKQVCRTNKSTKNETESLIQKVDIYSQQQQNQKLITNGVQTAEQKQSLVQLIINTQYTIRNLLLMIFCWLASFITFFLFNFYIKYIQGDIYLIAIAMGFSCLGYLFSDLIIKKFNVIYCLIFSYLITTIFLFLIVFLDPKTVPQLLYAFMFFMMKSFVCMSYSTIYVAHVEFFDAKILSTSFGLCGTVARVAGLFLPVIVEIENKQVPLIFVMLMNLVALICSFFLKKKTNISE
eukprot:403354919